MSWLFKLWLKMNGWKTVIGYILIQLPWFMAHPMIVDAINKIITNFDPATVEGAKAWADLIVQLILLTGIIHTTVKNVKYGTRRTK